MGIFGEKSGSKKRFGAEGKFSPGAHRGQGEGSGSPPPPPMVPGKPWGRPGGVSCYGRGGLAAQVQRSQPRMAVVGTGYSWLRTWFANVGAAVKASGMATIIGVGRLALAYPDFARDIVRNGRLDPYPEKAQCRLNEDRAAKA